MLIDEPVIMTSEVSSPYVIVVGDNCKVKIEASDNFAADPYGDFREFEVIDTYLGCPVREPDSSWCDVSIGTFSMDELFAGSNSFVLLAMNGTSATMLSPKASCTVEQSILLLYRVYNTASQQAQ